jgi:hypothetical protein
MLPLLIVEWSKADSVCAALDLEGYQARNGHVKIDAIHEEVHESPNFATVVQVTSLITSMFSGS